MAARRHHTVPTFLLSGFTQTGKHDGVLHVTNLRDGRTWRSNPTDTAHQRDYYRVEVPGVEPDAFEKELSRIETRAGVVIQEAVASLRPPEGDALDDLVRFLAIMGSRTSPTIDHWARQEEQIRRMALEMTIRHPKGFEGMMARARERGLNVGTVTPDGLMEALDNSDIRFPSTWTVHTLMMLAETMLPFLRPRNWSLLVARPESGHFVCSDMPAVMHDPTPRPSFYGPSFAHPKSEFSMPLTKDVLLLGRFESPSETGYVTAKSVAVLNSRAMMYAHHCYSPTPDFSWWMHGDRIGNARDHLAAITAARDKKGTDRRKA